MIFPQPLSIFYLLSMMVAISSTVFVWRFHMFRKKILKRLYTLPSVLVAGTKSSGKTSFIKTITGSITIHPFKDTFALGYMENGKVQLVELPYFSNSSINSLEEFKKLNLNSMIYVFDASRNAIQIESQIEYFENLKKIFGNIYTIIVANKIDDTDEEKLRRLESNFKKVYRTVLLDSFLDSLKDSMHIKKEIEDLIFLIQNLSSEIISQRKIDAVSEL